VVGSEVSLSGSLHAIALYKHQGRWFDEGPTRSLGSGVVFDGVASLTRSRILSVGYCASPTGYCATHRGGGIVETRQGKEWVRSPSLHPGKLFAVDHFRSLTLIVGSLGVVARIGGVWRKERTAVRGPADDVTLFADDGAIVCGPFGVEERNSTGGWRRIAILGMTDQDVIGRVTARRGYGWAVVQGQSSQFNAVHWNGKSLA
jgi:hypothetical protein